MCKSYKANKKIIEEYRDYFSQKYKSYNYKKKNNKVKKTAEEEPYYYKYQYIIKETLSIQVLIMSFFNIKINLNLK